MGVEGSNDHDKRASTVELAASHNVDLPDNVPLLVIPKQFLEKNTRLLRDISHLRRRGTEVRTYSWQPHKSPNEMQKDILEICRHWYRRWGIPV